jgi:Asp-tRNA(Asn)/Glu-tRNA(Gln) amidotransferase C subunit
VDHGGIWLVELSKCQVERVQTELERWLKFFIEGERLDDERLPDWMDTEEMRQAMNTLRQFSEKERDYHVYQARQNYLRQQRSIQRHLETLSAGIEQARAVDLLVWAVAGVGGTALDGCGTGAVGTVGRAGVGGDDVGGGVGGCLSGWRVAGVCS